MNKNQKRKANYLTAAYKEVLNAESMDPEAQVETMRRLMREADEAIDDSEQDEFDEDELRELYRAACENDDDDYRPPLGDIASDIGLNLVESGFNAVDHVLENTINGVENFFDTIFSWF